jgi:hypothetical protein
VFLLGVLGEVDAAVGGYVSEGQQQQQQQQGGEDADKGDEPRQGVKEAATDDGGAREETGLAGEEMGVAVARGHVIVEEEREGKVAVVEQKKKKARGDEFDDIFGALETKPPAKRAKKKRKVKGDEFDDIFGGL